MKYSKDIKRIKQAFKNLGIEVSEREAEIAWGRYSDSVCCNWCDGIKEMTDEEICNTCKDFLEKKYTVVKTSPIFEIQNIKFFSEEEALQWIENKEDKMKYIVAIYA